MSNDTRWRTAPGMHFRQVEDDYMIFDPVNEKMHVLNLTSALIWDACSEGATLSEILNEIRSSFSVVADLESQITAALREMLDAGLVIKG